MSATTSRAHKVGRNAEGEVCPLHAPDIAGPASHRGRLAVAAAAVLTGVLALTGFTLGVVGLPEAGENDFRISHMGPDGDSTVDAFHPDVAYNPTGDEYLVVWRAPPDASDFDSEVHGQRIDASTGRAVGTPDFRISDMGDAPSDGLEAREPRVAYDPDRHQYLVVWQGSEASLVEDVYGQFLDAATGAEVGDNDFQISQVGDDDLETDVEHPGVAYDGAEERFLVVWEGDHPVTGSREVFFQLLEANGDEVGGDVRLSSMGPDDSFDPFAGRAPAVDSAGGGEFLVVWEGREELDPGDLDGEFEIFGERVSAATGAPVGADDFRISTMGEAGDNDTFAVAPAIVPNPDDDEYLVAWEGVDDDDGEKEIWVQRIAADSGAEVGGAVPVSDAGPDGDAAYEATEPGLVYAPGDGRYLVVWEAEENEDGRVDGELEVHGQVLDRSANETGVNDFRISDVVGSGDQAHDAQGPRAAYSSVADEILVAWVADDTDSVPPPLASGEHEVFGQRLSVSLLDLFMAEVR